MLAHDLFLTFDVRDSVARVGSAAHVLGNGVLRRTRAAADHARWL